MQKLYLFTDDIFQSTLPLRGVTGICPGLCKDTPNFNPHSPCGE